MVSFEDFPPTRLTTEETQFMNRMITELPKTILSRKSVDENRMAERKIAEETKDTLDEDIEKH